MRTGTSEWAVRWAPLPDAPLRLFCVPHSGGGAATFRRWAEVLAPDIELVAIRLPGRETMFREPPCRSVEEAVPPLLEAVAPLLDRPFAWLGHSMGAVVAFEACRAVGRVADPGLLRRLIVAARPAPHLVGDPPVLHDAPVEEFLAGLNGLNGTPAELRADERMIRTFLPTLRADFRVVETYEPLPGPMLDCPVSAYGGLDDVVATADQLAGWSKYTSAESTVEMFPGAHFFVHEHYEEVIGRIAGLLRPVREAEAR